MSGYDFATGPTPHRSWKAVEDPLQMGQGEFELYADKALQVRLDAAGDRLAEEFEGVYDRDAIKAMVEDSARALSTNGVTPYVHILAERFTRERLAAQAHSERRTTGAVPQVVFVSLTGGGRAQIAAAMLAQQAGEAVSVHCAASGVSADIDENVRAAMDEVGIDLTDAFVRPLTSEVLGAADVVVTMGRSVGEVTIPDTARHVDWRVGDPAGASLDEVRRVREDIERRVAALAADLTDT